MSSVYNTQDLIRILATERKACMNGQRLSLPVSPSGNPAIDFFLKTDGIQSFTAYQNFRSAVHDYQRQHGVSGVVWHHLTFQGKPIRFPKVDDQLAALPNDLDLLDSAKAAIFEFWLDATRDLDLYLSLNAGKDYRKISPTDVDRIEQRSHWLSLQTQGKEPAQELILQLGWGQPEAAAYRQGFPESGSEYVHAVKPGGYPLG
ncbi:MAG TPA: hypothetical protein IGS53_28610 [Leptolyngbyaceae cyanobacterium M33_DOE_097]|uniref:Uncharacterized protein n=1 Tax=Oscillatoriales cyanobacterium SpSt-418 TaxID=2282169 RepID=A0A7C3PK60_9CYAN|nr:hypothetical protein [Leptolyngbyaceae cyanobacterium M33_DOE_097]